MQRPENTRLPTKVPCRRQKCRLRGVARSSPPAAQCAPRTPVRARCSSDKGDGDKNETPKRTGSSGNLNPRGFGLPISGSWFNDTVTEYEYIAP